MLKTYTYNALNFFLITFAISWTAWALAIYMSVHEPLHYLLFPFIMLGIAGPAISTLILLFISGNIELRADFTQRLKPNLIKPKYALITLSLFPCLIVLAILISLFFGQPIEQFFLTTQTADSALQGMSWIGILTAIFLVGPFEEIGWRGYAIDSLRTKFNLFKTSLLFGALWGIWHVPLFFVKNGAFQEIWHEGLFHTAIYFVCLFLISIITNWLYMKNNRSILIAILFHSVYDIAISIFHITPVTWVILTSLLFLCSAIIVCKNKKLFLKSMTI